MAEFGEGAPCWADAALSDLEAGKRFYGALFGWTFGDGDPERHGYTMAFRDGETAVGLMAKPDGRMPTVWSVYFSSPDAAATAERIRGAGGAVFMGPERVATNGTMLMAADPAGAVFGVWQGEDHPGFGVKDDPGSFCWTELYTRDPETADPFYRAVFGHHGEQVGRAGGDFDYEVWSVAGDPDRRPVAGRMRMGPGTPVELPAHFGVLFAVADCDEAVARVRELGGRVSIAPHDSPHGRVAAVVDDQGAHFTVIDLSKATE